MTEMERDLATLAAIGRRQQTLAEEMAVTRAALADAEAWMARTLPLVEEMEALKRENAPQNTTNWDAL